MPRMQRLLWIPCCRERRAKYFDRRRTAAACQAIEEGVGGCQREGGVCNGKCTGFLNRRVERSGRQRRRAATAGCSAEGGVSATLKMIVIGVLVLACKSNQRSEEIVLAGALRPLVALLKDSSSEGLLKGALAAVLGNLADGGQGECIIAAGALPPLVMLLNERSDDHVKGAVAYALGHLTYISEQLAQCSGF